MKDLDRRQLLRGASALGGGAALSALLPAWAQSGTPGIASTLPTVSGENIALTVGHTPFKVDGRAGHAITVNGTVPAPLVRLKEGQQVRLSVTNNLDEDTSIHWHGLLLPFEMDGVPGVSFPGIKPGETFNYEFKVRQAGTYWYHSHSGLQEQMGHYGPIVIDPAGEDPVKYDREHVIVLSDYSFMHPHEIFRKLKAHAGYFNMQKQTVAGLLQGQDQSFKDRKEWSKMLMDPTDVLDVTGSTYTFLINGHGPKDNWTGLFTPGERVRLRFVNAGAMTIFNVRIPGLKLSVVQTDGQNVVPVDVEEFQIAPAETYDIVVQPTADQAYTLVAEAADRSGMGRATLAPRLGMTAPVPPLRKRPLLNMRDMGMDHSAMPGMEGMEMDHSGMSMLDPRNAPQVKLGPGVQMISPMPADRTGDPGQGLEDVGHKVLTLKDLVSLDPNPDPRPPSRELEIHLTGNMERFMWAFDGVSYSHLKDPIPFRYNERVRVVLVNDSMMAHPIHLHGHFFEVVTGNPGRHPRKHTVNVLPGGKVAFDFTADERGDWAFHCHLLYHMHAGMFNVVTVRPLEGDAA
ncbi:copper resistance system multicopper oxidase [Phenylobacterium sp. NIBR 498073]|uniref:copper resistance system multicopper oxidase n=1 Tax=Phenylobacterium sp. NIBR 498073 TaxID=3015177 RepID=UPI0022B46333|nr:copper resistance system multicopper oxidase [Phenylobacterium sp. NIBR 498073]WGU38527.1 copper resistance system multicopper oxidase [Phenylobacterium sp. NIBR 498073]